VVCYKEFTERDAFAAFELGSPNIKVHVIGLSKSLTSLVNSMVHTPFLFLKSFSTDTRKFKKNYERNYYINFFNKIKYDVLHFEFSGLGISFLPVIDRLKGKKVVSCRGTAEKVKVIVDQNRRETLPQLFNKVGLVHCVSNNMRDFIEPFCSHPEKIFVNTPAIDANYFRPFEKKNTGHLRLLSVGRLAFVKGHLIGLLALRTLIARGINIKWDIIGDGPGLEEIVFHIHYLQLKDHVNLLGRRTKEEVNAILETTDIFMLTSYSEGIPNVILEAMSKELPVVTTRCGGVEEVIDHGIDGFIADTYDHDGIALYVQQLANDAALRISIGIAARKKIIAKFTIEKQAEVFEKYYYSLLNR